MKARVYRLQMHLVGSKNHLCVQRKVHLSGTVWNNPEKVYERWEVEGPCDGSCKGGARRYIRIPAEVAVIVSRAFSGGEKGTVINYTLYREEAPSVEVHRHSDLAPREAATPEGRTLGDKLHDALKKNKE